MDKMDEGVGMIRLGLKYKLQQAIKNKNWIIADKDAQFLKMLESFDNDPNVHSIESFVGYIIYLHPALKVFRNNPEFIEALLSVPNIETVFLRQFAILKCAKDAHQAQFKNVELNSKVVKALIDSSSVNDPPIALRALTEHQLHFWLEPNWSRNLMECHNSFTDKRIGHILFPENLIPKLKRYYKYHCNTGALLL